MDDQVKLVTVEERRVPARVRLEIPIGDGRMYHLDVSVLPLSDEAAALQAAVNRINAAYAAGRRAGLEQALAAVQAIKDECENPAAKLCHAHDVSAVRRLLRALLDKEPT